MDILKNNKLLFSVSLIYIIINVSLIYFDIYYGVLLPFIFLIVWYAFTNLKLVFLISVFFTPLSLLLTEFVPNTPVDLSIPTEPIFAGFLLIFILNFSTGKTIDKKIFRHPVSVAILINLFWLFITSITSSMPVVSFKFLLSRLWFVVPLFFWAVYFFKDKEFIKKYIWAYITAFVFIIFYASYNHISVGLFSKKIAQGVMKPFYNDHTSYGAILAMFIPVLTGWLFIKKQNKSFEIINFFLLALFLFALTFSYSRAAWISVAVVLIVFIIIKLKINRYILIFSGITLIALFFMFQFQILDNLKKNRQDSSGDLEKHVSSVTNIATDASNLERINRWNSAFKMFEERPIFGFGPGTYMFQYAPYQMSYDRTIISTDFGDVGNAHSEYIGPLAESGVFGTLTFLAIIITTLITGIKVYYRAKDKDIKVLVISLLMGLITYYIHGFLNNFLNTDKASVPFWGFTAIIVAVDLFHEPKNQNQE